MTEWEKCMAGEIYDCHAPIFIERKARASALCERYNSTPYTDKPERTRILHELFGSIGSNVSVGDHFTCGFGCNIRIGNNVSVNLNCTFIDCNSITIGDDVLIAPHVHLNTATHPVEWEERANPEWAPGSSVYRWRTYAKPIRIGSRCWLGAGVIVLPGVSIGEGSVIGAGSVVTRDIPPHCVAVGNPCRVIRQLKGA